MNNIDNIIMDRMAMLTDDEKEALDFLHDYMVDDKVDIYISACKVWLVIEPDVVDYMDDGYVVVGGYTFYGHIASEWYPSQYLQAEERLVDSLVGKVYSIFVLEMVRDLGNGSITMDQLGQIDGLVDGFMESSVYMFDGLREIVGKVFG